MRQGGLERWLQWLRALTALQEDLGSIPVPTWQLTPVYSYSSRSSDALTRHTCRINTNGHKIKINCKYLKRKEEEECRQTGE